MIPFKCCDVPHYSEFDKENFKIVRENPSIKGEVAMKKLKK